MIIKLESDVFFISERLKEIDKNYYAVFNTKTKKYEIHYEGQIGGSYCLSLPFDFLDERALEMVCKTRVENAKNLIKQIEEENEKNEKRNNKKVLENFKDVIKEGML